MKNKSSLFVVIEGIDGSGKTTLIQEIQNQFVQDEKINKIFKKIIYTREPGSAHIAFCTEIQKIILNKNHKLNKKTETLLFLANRSEHTEKLIEPALKENTLVICDRFYLSTLIYQGQNNQQQIEWIKQLQDYVTKLVPDITILIEITDEIFLNRYKNKSSKNKNNVFDDFVYNNLKKTQELYKKTIFENENKMGTIIEFNGNQNIEKKVKIIKNEILKKLNLLTDNS